MPLTVTAKPPVTIQHVMDAAVEAKLSFSPFDVTTFINGIGQAAVTQDDVRLAFKAMFETPPTGYKVGRKKGCTGKAYIVRWPDKTRTYPCSKGVKEIDVHTLQLE